jgi:hypothetical protein
MHRHCECSCRVVETCCSAPDVRPMRPAPEPPAGCVITEAVECRRCGWSRVGAAIKPDPAEGTPRE